MKYLISGFSDEIDESLDVQLEFMNKLHVKYMEIRGVDGKNISALTPQEVQAVKTKLDGAGVKISAVGSPIGKININEGFEPHFELFKRVCETAKILDTKNIRMFSFFIPQGEDPMTYREEVLRRLKIMIKYAADHDIVLMHENEKDIYGDIASRCLDLMNELYCKNFVCVFDFANFIQCGQETSAAYELLKPYIKYVHIKDASGMQVMPAGMGEGKVEEILSLLYREGYDGFLSLEPHLADFAGFSALEHKDATSKKLTDGKFAWWSALNALKAILYNME